MSTNDQKKSILISIDDTDEIGTKGTGEILEMMIEEISGKINSIWSAVTRHQLFICDEIEYTSHNSSMCTIGMVDSTVEIDQLRGISEKFLKENSAPTSDPGLCIIDLNKISESDKNRLVDYGKRAKIEVFTKCDAYQLAKELDIYLEEHGGAGIGVIGALAGAGLRISGNDGRFKGKLKIDGINRFEGEIYSDKRILEHKLIDEIRDLETDKVVSNIEIILNDKLKAVLKDGKAVLYVTPTEDGIYRNLSKRETRQF